MRTSFHLDMKTDYKNRCLHNHICAEPQASPIGYRPQSLRFNTTSTLVVDALRTEPAISSNSSRWFVMPHSCGSDANSDPPPAGPRTSWHYAGQDTTRLRHLQIPLWTQVRRHKPYYGSTTLYLATSLMASRSYKTVTNYHGINARMAMRLYVFPSTPRPSRPALFRIAQRSISDTTDPRQRREVGGTPWLIV